MPSGPSLLVLREITVWAAESLVRKAVEYFILSSGRQFASMDQLDCGSLSRERLHGLPFHELRKQAEEWLQKTTFEEFIRYCHAFLSERATKGELTGASGRLCPTYIRPWSAFLSLQLQIFDSVYKLLHPPGEAPSRLLPSSDTQEELGRRICHRPLASEADLAYYERNTVEDQVYKAITALGSVQAAKELFFLNDEIDFYTNLSAFDSDPLKPAGVDDFLKLKRSVADQFCVRCGENSAGTLFYTIEYKSPHKLSLDCAR
ncbi:hypothetical protein V1517DRAFT_338647 [Lipomyces orientalis]|uniref:Uncharacterized protein n=1 Tax=Lipomyces orientalis TaxID=1233043 RepID=A0ACC3TNF5_9ASCO